MMWAQSLLTRYIHSGVLGLRPWLLFQLMETSAGHGWVYTCVGPVMVGLQARPTNHLTELHRGIPASDPFCYPTFIGCGDLVHFLSFSAVSNTVIRLAPRTYITNYVHLGFTVSKPLPLNFERIYKQLESIDPNVSHFTLCSLFFKWNLYKEEVRKVNPTNGSRKE